MPRYKAGHAEETKQRLVQAASERLRKEGVDGVGVASLMSDLGLTHGGFYAHFPSKELLVQDAAIFALRCKSTEKAMAATPDKLRAFIENYLSAESRDDVMQFCPVAALSSDLVRRPRATRAAFSAELSRMLSELANYIQGGDQASKIALAWSLFGQLVGTLQMARLVSDKTLSDEILESGRKNALKMVGLSDKPPPARKRSKVVV
jgi:TetR/AcrR family transcriptional regulator, transcriptional repressor for nem operon